MFTLPAISGNSRYCADSSGIMPLNALNGSSYMYNDESSTLSRPPSYEEAVSSDSMFGLFIVNSGDSYHNSVSHQHAHHDQLDQPPNYHDLLSPTGSTASADKPSNRNAPYVSRDSDTAEYLDTSLDNQCTRFSQIDIVGSTSTLTSPVPADQARCSCAHHEAKTVRRRKRRHILCACTSLLLVIVVVALIILTTSGLLANHTKTSSDTNMATDATNKLYLTVERPS
ncbi:uncharacterized protein LOC112553279 isoform X2 [Pomacea canaliculata]|uniref:uncharacterized protein LOC112553279 isoform X2 n=1 Tax=Pomacea canaliculata TaxID=400727 RepID=UPI000D739A95|nr:uncharacterized protein LOC112553279 isoform X2 [Pomacea canaliculata]